MSFNLASDASTDPNRITLSAAPKDEPIVPDYSPEVREAIGLHRMLVRQHADGFRIDQTLHANGLGRFTVLPAHVLAEELRLKSVIIHGQLDAEERFHLDRAPTHVVRLMGRAAAAGLAQAVKPVQDDVRPGKPKKRTSKTRR